MSANEPISQQVQKHRKTWQELWYAMAKGDPIAYKEVKSMDIMEFYPFFDKWRVQMKNEQKNKKNGR